MGSPIFLYSYKTKYELLLSAILTRSFTLPAGYTYVIPEACSLVIKKGRNFVFIPAVGWTTAMAAAFTATWRKTPPWFSSVKVTGAKVVMGGKTTTLKATLTGTGGHTPDVQTLRWTSSDAAVATVDSKGVVTAKKLDSAETVTITATAQDGRGASGSFELQVVPFAARIVLSPIGPQTIDLASATPSVRLHASVLPADAGQT